VAVDMLLAIRVDKVRRPFYFIALFSTAYFHLDVSQKGFVVVSFIIFIFFFIYSATVSVSGDKIR
jgi:hypothetical protein